MHLLTVLTLKLASFVKTSCVLHNQAVFSYTNTEKKKEGVTFTVLSNKLTLLQVNQGKLGSFEYITSMET